MNQLSSSSFSSVEVVSHCDDLVTEILLRLPLHSVFKFKCVSKTWNRLISDPTFCINYQSRRKNSLLPLLGFFRSNLSNDRSKLQLSFLRNCKERKVTEFDYIENYFVRDSSPEGLILCTLVSLYYVCNPIRNQWFALPEPNNAQGQSYASLSCEECSKDGVVHFKVIRATFKREEGAMNDGIQTQTFSSRTGEWSEISFLTSPSEFSLGRPHGGESVGGIFYWKVSGYLAAYDPNIGENRLWLIRLPARIRETQKYFMNFILGQSPDGCLRFAINDKDQFRVWDLKKKLSSYGLRRTIPSSEWRLKEVVSYKMLNLINHHAKGHNPHIRRLKKYPCLNAFHPRNPKLVYLLRGSVMFCYDLETRVVERIEYHGKQTAGAVFANDSRIFPYFQPPWLPSLPPLGLS